MTAWLPSWKKVSCVVLGHSICAKGFWRKPLLFRMRAATSCPVQVLGHKAKGNSHPINILFAALTLFSICNFFLPSAYANNLNISSVSIVSRDSTAGTVTIQFNISWDHSWRNPANYDAAWVFVKYSTDAGVTWSHASLKTSGTNPSGFSTGAGTAIEIVVPTDKKGAFIQRSTAGAGTLSTATVKFVWDYSTDGVSAGASVTLDVFGIEMVYIPTTTYGLGAGCTNGFQVGDRSSPYFLEQGSSDTDPWCITSEAAITTTSGASNGYYYVDTNCTGCGDESTTGLVFTIPAGYPKGYRAFYLMKYEVTQGQYKDFLNTLTRTQQGKRVASTISGDTITNTFVMSNASVITSRNAIQAPASGNGTSAPVVFNTLVSNVDKKDRAANYISWMDDCAFADWAALRPMTELEFEKAARGPNAAVQDEYAWGNTTLTNAVTISGTENGTETISTASANANYNNTTYVDGDAGTGPLRGGIFATSTSTRTQAGAGYYGNMNLSDNEREKLVAVGNPTGRAFNGTHGDGVLTTASGYEGNATNADWPGFTSGQGVSGAAGSGHTMGSHEISTIANLRISDRTEKERPDGSRYGAFGFRAARTAP